MQLAKEFPPPARSGDPHFTDPRPVGAQVAFTARTGTTYYTTVQRADPKYAPAVPYASFDDAKRAGVALARAEYDANVKGSFFWKKEPQVAAFAIRQAQDGVELVRTTSPIDAYDYRDGYIFRQWAHRPAQTLAKATDPALLALVSHRTMFDFRGTDGEVVPSRKV